MQGCPVLFCLYNPFHTQRTLWWRSQYRFYEARCSFLGLVLEGGEKVESDLCRCETLFTAESKHQQAGAAEHARPQARSFKRMTFHGRCKVQRKRRTCATNRAPLVYGTISPCFCRCRPCSACASAPPRPRANLISRRDSFVGAPISLLKIEFSSLPWVERKKK